MYTLAEVASDRLIPSPPAKLVTEEAGASVVVQVGSVALAFWLFTAICVLSCIFGLTIMPETKGRTLEEIADSWQHETP